MSADSSRRTVEQLGDPFVYTTLVIHTSCVVNTCAEVIGAPRLLLSNLEVSQGEETLYGQGAVQYDGHIVLDLASGRKQVRLTGFLLPLHPDSAVPGR